MKIYLIAVKLSKSHKPEILEFKTKKRQEVFYRFNKRLARNNVRNF